MQAQSAPLVSILIPAYNAERWIAQSIASAAAQTWPNKEIIVVDDGSTDRTASVASALASESLRVHRQANQGAAAARNTAFELCRGDYIQWLDADDLLDPDKIERQIAAVAAGSEARVLLSGAWGTFYSRPERAKFAPSPLWETLGPLEWLRRKMASGSDFMAIEGWLVSRELTEAAGPWDRRLIVDDDGEYFCRVLLACSEVRFVEDSRIRVRRSGAGRGEPHRPLAGEDRRAAPVVRVARRLPAVARRQRGDARRLPAVRGKVRGLYPAVGARARAPRDGAAGIRWRKDALQRTRGFRIR